MKILYNQIKELVPGLSATAKEIGEMLTMVGFLNDTFQEVSRQGKPDFMLGLEVRQNRPDCLSVVGIAREVAAYYHLPLELPAGRSFVSSAEALPVTVRAVDHVKRIMAIRFKNAKNGDSPAWLKEYLALYDINSINLLVDISNYVMIFTGYTSHLLDADKLTGGLTWTVNDKERRIRTLDNTELTLQGGELVIEDEADVLALAGIVGCQPAAIGAKSKNLIAEMAVYDRAIIQRNSRSLAVVTEASNRLSKDMSPEGADYAFSLLIKMIAEESGAKPEGQVYDYYPEVQSERVVAFNPELPERLAGIDLSPERVREILEDLRCQVEMSDPLSWRITVPSDRLDLELPEDLAEDVLRINRFDSIPGDEAPLLAIVPDITVPLWRLKEKMRDALSAWGYDEILSQPLVSNMANSLVNWQSWEPIVTQNSVNEEYPALRQSIGAGLTGQLEEYVKKNVWPIRIFEIGKVFGRRKGEVLEPEMVGALWVSDKAGLSAMQDDALRLLSKLGLEEVSFITAQVIPPAANPFSTFAIHHEGRQIGLLAKLKPFDRYANIYYFEINLSVIPARKDSSPATAELTRKLVALDANLELSGVDELNKKLFKLKENAGRALWDLSVIDIYKLSEQKSRYTVRAVYAELSDQEAKEMHLKLFSLK